MASAPGDASLLKLEYLFELFLHDLLEEAHAEAFACKARHQEHVQKTVHRALWRVGGIGQRFETADRMMETGRRFVRDVRGHACADETDNVTRLRKFFTGDAAGADLRPELLDTERRDKIDECSADRSDLKIGRDRFRQQGNSILYLRDGVRLYFKDLADSLFRVLPVELDDRTHGG